MSAVTTLRPLSATTASVVRDAVNDLKRIPDGRLHRYVVESKGLAATR